MLLSGFTEGKEETPTTHNQESVKTESPHERDQKEKDKPPVTSPGKLARKFLSVWNSGWGKNYSPMKN